MTNSFCLTVLLCLAASLIAGPSDAQQLNRQLTDPQAIAEECGGDAALGAPLFAQNCAACHSLTEDDGTGQGPHLAGLYGRIAGSVETFDYTTALPQSPISWEGDTLRAYLAGQTEHAHPVFEDAQMVRDILTHVRIATRPAPPQPHEVTVPEHVLAMDGDVAFGEYLSSGCTQCHNDSAVDGGMRMIRGLEAETFLQLMYLYRERALPNEIMQIQAGRFSEEELAALAAYFEQVTQ